MQQLKKIWIFCKIYALAQTNSFIYYLYRIPLVNMFVPKNMYRYEKLKSIFFFGGALKSFVQSAIGVNLCFWLLLDWFPTLFGDVVTVEGKTYICLLICCVLPAILQCKIFTAREEDYLFLNHFMVEPSEYYHMKIAKDALANGIYLIPILWYLLRQPELIALVVVAKLFFVLLGCRFYLYIYDKRQKVIKRTYRYLTGLGILVLVYLLWYLGMWNRVGLTREAVIILGVLMLVLSVGLYNQLLHFGAYKKIAVQFANKDVVMFKVSAVSVVDEGQQAFADSSELKCEKYFEENKNLDIATYLNKTFFLRLKKSFSGYRKQVVWVNLLFGVIIGGLVRADVLKLTDQTILQYTPILIALISGLMLYGRNFSAMCFYYVDAPFLYHHLFGKEFLKKSIRLRYIYLLKNSLWVLLWLSVNFVLIMSVGGLYIAWPKIVFLLLTLECFVVSYEIYNQLIYYFLQPYTLDVTVKSPLFSWLGILEGVLDIGVLFVRGSIINVFCPMLLICIVLNLVLLFSTERMYKVFRLGY